MSITRHTAPLEKDDWVLTTDDQINFTKLAPLVIRVQFSDPTIVHQGMLRHTCVSLMNGQQHTFFGEASRKFDELWKAKLNSELTR